MSRGFSLYLDALRALAALVVLLSHFAYPRFTGGDYLVLRELNVGSDAVVLFFVLSGFVIAFTVDSKDRSWRQFAFNRATRLYSVALPALFLTLFFDALGSLIDPASYDGWWHNKAPFVVSVPISVLFANEWSGISLRLGTNGPYWSLSYEAAYYVLFGLMVYSSGLRRALLLMAMMLIVGPKVLVLMPAWIFGAAVYHRLSAAAPLPDVRRRVGALCVALGSISLYAVFVATDVPRMLLGLSVVALGSESIAFLGFSDEFVWNALIGALFAAHFYAVGQLLRHSEDSIRSNNVIRWIAGASFSIYLVHYPSLQLVDALLPETQGLVRDAALLVITLGICLVFANFFERPLASIRNSVRHLSSFLLPRSDEERPG